jgi:geranylgeranyl diphosphate synthase type I
MTTSVGTPLGPRLEVMRAGVDAVLREDLARRVTASRDPDWEYGVGLVRRLVLGGGKRIRPAMCLLGWSAYGGGDAPGVLRVGAALELFHAFALIQDDVMDDSRTRRGRPAVHVDLAARHRGHGRRGDAPRFGRNAAVLWGDLCLVWSDELFHGCGLSAARVSRALGLLHAMRSEVLLGQYLDIRGDATAVDLAGCLEVMRYKSAGYTVERPLQIGAALAGAGPEQLRALSGYGIPLGEAFQLRDDVLGVFGDDAVTGKSALTDLRDGKSTVLMALTRRHASAAQAEVLRRWVGNPELDADGAAAVRRVVVEAGGLARVEDMIATRAEAAVEALSGLAITDEDRAALTEMVSLLIRRNS